ncbi:hypothetical protein CTAYLR_003947 [Chrysophaeum taylorii]|uniref:HSF-type DNA-binding domain-containing protein n=1 Tax=Chrysophaeum taylorii TaxID=2483200 RepID=A0AAD7U9K3_9STRA|nr:hypothetical protein CTAYLR_003947 [Chrysophaeum taylorii]
MLKDTHHDSHEDQFRCPYNKPRQRRKTSKFMRKLLSLMAQHPTVIWFEENSIVISDPQRLEAVLDKHFGHHHYTSLQKQLNNFGFNKVIKPSHPFLTTYVKVRGTAVTKISDLLDLQPIHSIPRRRAVGAKFIDEDNKVNKHNDVEQPVPSHTSPLLLPSPQFGFVPPFRVLFPALPLAPPVEPSALFKQPEDAPEKLARTYDHLPLAPTPPREVALPSSSPFALGNFASPFCRDDTVLDDYDIFPLLLADDFEPEYYDIFGLLLAEDF